ncbi:hypothetical protein Q7C36_008134 [Tachysurus vachellii]|uniref:Uncharacterized protein n=1 Tax=Tachysurus vachellii TaxID=175792 RepID=A0AA88N6P1_TACVA|nr:hypothetical protein Q7C36_008134 [Tachysurus vachellii]
MQNEEIRKQISGLRDELKGAIDQANIKAKFVSWNVRGLNHPVKRKVLKIDELPLTNNRFLNLLKWKTQPCCAGEMPPMVSLDWVELMKKSL